MENTECLGGWSALPVRPVKGECAPRVLHPSATQQRKRRISPNLSVIVLEFAASSWVIPGVKHCEMLLEELPFKS